MVKETKVEKKPRGNEKRYGIGVFRDWIVWRISALVSVSLSATVERVVGKAWLWWLIRSREIPKNGSGNRNWGNPKDVNEQLYKTLVETAYL